jgi:hypothetical protein
MLIRIYAYMLTPIWVIQPLDCNRNGMNRDSPHCLPSPTDWLHRPGHIQLMAQNAEGLQYHTHMMLSDQTHSRCQKVRVDRHK